MNCEDLLNVVLVFESAPSAHILVKSIQEERELSDEECDDIYNFSEGHNDSETERLIKSMTSTQIESLKETLRQINEEYKVSYTEDEYQDMVGDTDIDSVLN